APMTASRTGPGGGGALRPTPGAQPRPPRPTPRGPPPPRRSGCCQERPARHSSGQARRRGPGHLRLSARAVAVRLPVADPSRSQGLPQFAAGLTAHKKSGNSAASFPSNLPTKAASMRAMKIAMSVLACATALLAACGMADQYATFLPKSLRQPSTEPPPPEPEPDVKAMVRAGADTLFTAHPTTVAVSRPHPVAGRGFSACVKAMVVGPMNPEPQPI